MIPHNIRAFLASNLDFTGELIRNQMALSGARVLLIPTATYAEGRPLKPDQPDAYAARGAQVEVIDLHDIPTTTHTYAALARADVVHLCGGNTFALLHAMQRAGLGEAMAWQAKRRPLTVVGESAGALVLGGNISHIAPLDDPAAAPKLRNTMGLGYVPDLLVPHYKAQAWGFGARIDAWLARDPHASSYTLLRDTQALEVSKSGRALHSV